ncbi:MAG: thiamine pyrophosphate-binding protein, partial [Bacteroidetes bacterium]|nr:thiamine pyrophosphate-binding protein [Bacteroidota bacterium]
PVTKWNYQISNAEEIPEVMAKAFYVARSGRPGPVLIDITKNAQIQKFDFSYKRCNYVRSYKPRPKLDLIKIQQAADLINNAKKPYLIWGQGILLANAQEELKTLIEKSGIPAAWTILGLSALPAGHPLDVGMLGMHGNYGPNIKTNECDVLIAVGMRFDDRITGSLNTYAKQAKVIHIEIDPSEIDKNVKTHVAVNADAKEALNALIPMVDKKDHSNWIQEFRDCDKIEYEKIIKEELYPTSKGLKMGEVVRLISEKTKGEAIIVSDVGQHQMITHRYYKFNKSHSNVTSGGLGTMGFALPAAIGAKISKPEREVIAIIGDGGFQMTLQELGTVFQYKIPVKVVVLNNNFLGMVRQWQQLFFDKRYSSTELVNPDFITIAKGFGLETQKVTERKNLEGAIEELITHKGAYFLEVVVEKEDNVFPMIPAGESVSNIKLGPNE